MRPAQGKPDDRAQYHRRTPEDTILYETVRSELETFLVRAQASGRNVPAFVERELRAYLQCGILAHGFVRVHCDACGHDRVVALSCKGRGFCPSCGGRRMAETAAFLVDKVLPRVPVRQWVLSLPIELRYRLGCDSRLTAAVLQLFIRAVFASLRRRARRRWGRANYACGAITFIQRFGDALNLNVHFHSLVLDGVYDPRVKGKTRFHRLPPPSDAEIERVTRNVVRRLRRLLLRRGLGPDADRTDADPLFSESPLLAEIYAASVRSRTALAEQAGRRLLRIGQLMDPEEAAFTRGPRCASIDGVSLHANVRVPASDRHRLEKLCRYIARPPVSTQRLSRLDDGRLLYRLKRRWRDGTTHVVFDGLELVEKLVAIVPPPRCHMVRYHGVLAPRAHRRSDIVAEARQTARRLHAVGRRPDPSVPRTVSCRATERIHHETPAHGRATADGFAAASNVTPTGRQWIPWAELMRRVFDVDVLECPKCKGPMRIIKVVLPPDATREILDSMQLAARAPPLAPARRDLEGAPFVD